MLRELLPFRPPSSRSESVLGACPGQGTLPSCDGHTLNPTWATSPGRRHLDCPTWTTSMSDPTWVNPPEPLHLDCPTWVTLLG